MDRACLPSGTTSMDCKFYLFFQLNSSVISEHDQWGGLNINTECYVWADSQTQCNIKFDRKVS